jgi:hypothetical protein
MRRAVLSLACMAAVSMASDAALAQTWIGTTASGNSAWSDPANWQGGTVPVSGSSTVLNFYADTLSGPGAGTTVTSYQDLADPFNLNVLNLRGTTTGGPGVEGVVTITNRPTDSPADYTKALVFSGTNNQINVLADYGAGAGTTYRLRVPMVFQTDTSITLANSGANVSFNNYFDAGSGRLTITNNAPTRTIKFNGDAVNSGNVLYTGNIVLTKGVVELGKRHSIFGVNAATTQTFTVNAGAQVLFNYGDASFIQGQNFVLNGDANPADGATGTAALRMIGLSFGNAQIGGLALAANSTVSINYQVGSTGNPTARGVLVNQPVVGTGNLTTAGNSLLILTKATPAAALTWDGVSYAPYSGNVYVSSGTGLQLQNVHDVLGKNGTSTALGGQTITVASGASLILNDGNGAYRTYQNVVLNGGGGYLTNANLFVNNVNGFSAGSLGHELGRLVLAAGDSTINVTRNSAAAAGNGAQVLGGVLGTGNLVKNGTGPLHINVPSAAATVDGVSYPVFSGNVLVNAGWLQLGKASGILGANGTAATPGDQTVTVASGASARFVPNNAAYNYNQNFVISGTGYSVTIGTTTPVTTAFAALQFEDQNGFGGNGSTIGGLALPADATVSVGRNAAAAATSGVTVNGVISGTGALTKLGAGPLYVNRTSTSRTLAGTTYGVYSGNVNVNGGWLQLGANDNILGPNGTFAAPGAQTVTVANGASVVFSNNNAAYLANQNYVLNGTGYSVTIGTTTPVTTSFAALQVNNLNFGDHRIAGLGAATDATVSINLNATPDNPGRALSTAGLAGPGVLTLQGNGTLALRGPAAAIGSLPAFSGTVITSTAKLLVGNADAFGTGGLTVGNGSATVAAGLPKGVALSSLTFTGSGQLQINDATAVIRYAGASPIDAIRATLASTSPSIITSLSTANPNVAVGYGQASAIGAANSDYRGVTIGADALIVRPTLYGDATLDGTVNFDDLLKLAANYNQSGAYWTDGDFTYDGTVNFDDLLKLAANYNQTLSGSLAGDWALAQAAVPEPTSLAIVGALAGMALRRRRR